MLYGLLSAKSGEADAVISATADRLSLAGAIVAGVVQANIERAGRCRCDMVLKDLASGREILISQYRGEGARGCRLDHGALETAVGWVEASIRPDVDVVLLNKFGKREAEGAGLRSAIAAAVAYDIPVIAGLGPENREAWEIFCGDAGRVFTIDRIGEVLTILGQQGHFSPDNTDRHAPLGA